MKVGLAPEVVTLGETMVVLYPARQDAALARADSLKIDVGGADSNFAIAMVRLGFTTGWISRLGQDPFGDRVLRHVASQGVDVSQVRRDRRHPTGLYIKYLTDDRREQVSYYRRGSAAAHLRPQDVQREYFARAKLLHLNGMTCALSRTCLATVAHAMDLATGCGAMVSFDLNLRLQLWRAAAARTALIPLLSRASVVLGTEDEFRVIFSEDSLTRALDAAVALGPRVAVAKRGVHGALLHTSGGDVLRHPGFRPPKVVDSVGAGDGFDAGFMAALLTGKDVELALRQGNLVGAAAVMVAGDCNGYPDVQQLAGFERAWPVAEEIDVD